MARELGLPKQQLLAAKAAFLFLCSLACAVRIEEMDVCDGVESSLSSKCRAAMFVLDFLAESQARQHEALDKMCQPLPWAAGWRTKNLPPATGPATYPTPENGTFETKDLVPPSIHPAEHWLSLLNQVTLQYSGNWDRRQHDSVILECGHNSGLYGDRVYYDAHVDASLNKQAQGSAIDETTCPLNCFARSRKLLHNKIWKDVFGEESLLHPDCVSPSSCPDDDACTDPLRAFRLRASRSQDISCTDSGKPAPKAAFIVGVPASGKDAVLKDEVKYFMGGEKYVEADPDGFKDMLVEEGTDALAMLVKKLAGTVKQTDPRPFVRKHYSIMQILAQHVHRESIILGYQAQQEAMGQCRNFALQKTGTNWNDLKTYVQAAKARGYEVHVYAAHLHPFTNWANHLHRVKHFGSAGRAMQREQVIKDNFYFPKAIQQMTQDYIDGLNKGHLIIDDLKLFVYRDIVDVIKKKEGAKIDLFSTSEEMSNILGLWDMYANFRTGANLFKFFQKRRTKYSEELNEVVDNEHLLADFMRVFSDKDDADMSRYADYDYSTEETLGKSGWVGAGLPSL